MIICNLNIIITSDGKGVNTNTANWGNGNDLCYEGTLYNFLITPYGSSKFKNIVESEFYDHINVNVTGSSFLGLYLKKRCNKLSDKVTVKFSAIHNNGNWFTKTFSVLQVAVKKFFIFQENGNYSLEMIFRKNHLGLDLFRKLFETVEISDSSGNEENDKTEIPPYLFLLSRDNWQKLPMQKSFFSFGEVSNETEADISDSADGPYCHWNIAGNEFQETISAYLLDCFAFSEIARTLDKKLKEDAFFSNIEEVCALFALRENTESYLATLDNTNVIVGRKSCINIYECLTGSISTKVPEKNSVVIQGNNTESSLDKNMESGKIELTTSNFSLIKKEFTLSFENWPQLLAVLSKGKGKNKDKWQLSYKRVFNLTVRGDGSVCEFKVKDLDSSANVYTVNKDETCNMQITAVYYDTPSKNKEENPEIFPEKIAVSMDGKTIKEVEPANVDSIKEQWDYIFMVDKFPCCAVGRHEIIICGKRSRKSLCFSLNVRDPNAVPDDLIVEDFKICEVCKKDTAWDNEKLQISKDGADIVVKYPGNVKKISFRPKYVRRGHEEEYGGTVYLNGKPSIINSRELVTICPTGNARIEIKSAREIIKTDKKITIVFEKEMHPCLLLTLGGLVLTLVNLSIHCFIWYGLPLTLLAIYSLPLFLNLHYLLKFSFKINSKEQIMANSIWILTTLLSMLVIFFALQEEMH